MPQEEGEREGEKAEREVSVLLRGGNEETEWSRTKADFIRNGKSLGPWREKRGRTFLVQGSYRFSLAMNCGFL